VSDVETVEVPGSHATTTRIGFGCSNLLGDKTRDAGLGLLHTAYEEGILHYDVARVYNYGDAEALVGEFASGKRDKITITTKFGLMPRGNVAKLKGPVQFVRRLMRSSSVVRNLVRRNVKTLTQAGQFDPVSAQASLETSLRTLRTDYVDIYLLHEARVTDCTDEILSFLEKAKAEGKIRAFGCGSGFEKVPEIAAGRPDLLQVAQFESSLPKSHIGEFRGIRPAQNLFSITHGEMSAATLIKNRIAADPLIARRWSDDIGVDLSEGSNVYGLLMYHALRENSGGIVLFRAAAAERIRATLAATRQVRLTDAQFDALRAIGKELAQDVSAASPN
jgi:diketogulonate reductase-like aldo/keto reductase